MAVVHDELAQRAEVARVDAALRRVDARVPRRLVVGEQVDARRLSGLGHGAGVVEADREWLLDQNVDTSRGSPFHDGAVVLDRREDGHRLGLGGVEHCIKVGIDEVHRIAVLLGVALGEVAVGLHDADDLDVAAVLAPEDPVDVRVDEPNAADTDGLRFVGRGLVGRRLVGCGLCVRGMGQGEEEQRERESNE